MALFSQTLLQFSWQNKLERTHLKNFALLMEYVFQLDQFWRHGFVELSTYLGFWLRLVKKRVLVVQLNFGLFVWLSFGTFLLALSISCSLIEDWRA